MRELADAPIYSLFQIGSSLQLLNKRSERDFGLSLVQWYLLRRLVDMPACSPLALASAVGVQPSTLTQSMKRLGRKGLLILVHDPRDSRKKLVSITRQGKKALDEASGKILLWSTNIEPLTPEIHRVRECLRSQVDREI